jgi:hypothetical protein
VKRLPETEEDFPAVIGGEGDTDHVVVTAGDFQRFTGYRIPAGIIFIVIQRKINIASGLLCGNAAENFCALFFISLKGRNPFCDNQIILYIFGIRFRGKIIVREHTHGILLVIRIDPVRITGKRKIIQIPSAIYGGQNRQGEKNHVHGGLGVNII